MCSKHVLDVRPLHAQTLTHSSRFNADSEELSSNEQKISKSSISQSKKRKKRRHRL